MKKGDERKETIIATAKELFCSKGYENTSIQDILDQLSLSKGCFYHHFESKGELLEEIAKTHGVGLAAFVKEKVDGCTSALDKLNTLFEYCSLWRSDDGGISQLMLEAAYMGGNAQLKDCLRSILHNTARPLIDEIIAQGMEEKVFLTRYPADLGTLILNLYANLSDMLAETLVKNGDKGLALTHINMYRSSIETLLCAPFGSVQLCNFNDLIALWNREGETK